ncbi:hypothetical protein RF11_01627 [Thelohanellus kitauei]|uniref:Uncharacterized protein n=1 Tax=Thelohanellus kitauei TaxID=669202 RepID=A0A0C2IXS9_THEKT|nr:hypothetical protein RF11_01627 [Thelohanellus kitauei]
MEKVQEPLKQSNLKITFKVYFNRALVSPLITSLVAGTRLLCCTACLFATLPLVFLATMNGYQHRPQSFSCELRFCVSSYVIHQEKKHSIGALVPGRDSANCTWRSIASN